MLAPRENRVQKDRGRRTVTSMKIATDSIVSVQYTLKNSEGELLDQSDEADPLIYLHGHGTIVPGLEKALEGHEVGDLVRAVVPPEEGYGHKSGEAPLRGPSGAEKE